MYPKTKHEVTSLSIRSEDEAMLDIDIRQEMKSSLLNDFLKDGQSRIVDELVLCYGDARIDIAVINGSFFGYEIKSESDDLRRLPSQVETYLKVFDFLTIVTCKNHVAGVSSLIPEQCGVITAEKSKKGNRIILNPIRPSLKNPLIDKHALIQLLWKDELLEILGQHLLKGFKSKSKPYLWDLVCELLSVEETSQIVREKIKARSDWRVG